MWIRCRRPFTGMVPILLVWLGGVHLPRPVPVHANNCMLRSPAGIRPGSAFVHCLHRWSDRHHWGSRSLPSSVCRWYADPGLLLPWLRRLAPVYSVWLSWRGVRLDAFESATTKYIEDRDTLVFDVPPASPIAYDRCLDRRRLCLSIVSCSRFGPHDRQRRLCAVARSTDCIWLFCSLMPDT